MKNRVFISSFYVNIGSKNEGKITTFNQISQLMKVAHFSGIIVAGLMQSFSLTSFSQDVNNLKLKDYRPVSIYKGPRTEIQKAKYPAIDVHAHDSKDTDVDKLVALMDELGIEKRII